MKELVDLISKSEGILNCLENQEFFDGNIEISRMLQKIDDKDELVGNTLRILTTLRYFPINEFVLRLKVKLCLILKYKIGDSKNFDEERLIELLNEKDSVFLARNLCSRPQNKRFYFSKKILEWAEELYYLFSKISNEDKQIYEIVNLLDSARVTATQKVVDDLKLKLDVFLKDGWQNKKFD